MAKVHIDVSIFTEKTAFGRVSGPLELAVVPQTGDIISFGFAEPFEAYVGERRLPFNGHLRVTDRIIEADGDADILLALEDVTAITSEDARRLLEWFEKCHGLFGDVWDI